MSVGDVVIGPYRMDLDRSDSMVRISLFPSDLLKHRSRCRLGADFAGSFFSFRFPDFRKARNSLSVIMNELVENAVKFSNTPRANIAINPFTMTDLIVFEVENYADRPQFESFQATVRELLECDDIEAKHFEVLTSGVSNPEDSGLGLLTIVHDFSARIGVRFTETDADTRRVSLQVIVPREELME